MKVSKHLQKPTCSGPCTYNDTNILAELANQLINKSKLHACNVILGISSLTAKLFKHQETVHRKIRRYHSTNTPSHKLQPEWK